jgi:hypothetical protein
MACWRSTDSDSRTLGKAVAFDAYLAKVATGLGVIGGVGIGVMGFGLPKRSPRPAAEGVGVGAESVSKRRKEDRRGELTGLPWWNSVFRRPVISHAVLLRGTRRCWEEPAGVTRGLLSTFWVGLEIFLDSFRDPF